MMVPLRSLLLSLAGAPLVALPAVAQVRVVPEERVEIERISRRLDAVRKLLEARAVQETEIVSRARADVRARAEAATARLHAALLAQQEVMDLTTARATYGFVREPGAIPQVRWYQEDPADSLFRVAHDLFTEQEYRPAAERYAELRSRYSDSRYFCDAAYYEAFARYRLGTPDDLRTANRVLEQTAEACSSGERSEDVPELRMRIDGALARLGDADAAERLRRAASAGQDICDREESSVKVAALSALAEMDRATADPVLRGVLATRDECSAPVRRRAVTIVARRDDADAVAILSDVARGDPDRGTRHEAVEALGRMSSDAAHETLEQLLFDPSDEQVQAEAAEALARSEHPRAEAAVRNLIMRTDVVDDIRIAAIDGLARRDPPPSLESWRSIYARANSDGLREAVIEGMSRAHEDAAYAFLLGIAQDRSTSTDVREAALSRIRSYASILELYRLYEAAGSRSIRRSIVNGLSRRDEAEATDRLIDIAKTSTDPDVRAAAIRALGRDSRKNDPEVVRALTEILGCCEPEY